MCHNILAINVILCCHHPTGWVGAEDNTIGASPKNSIGLTLTSRSKVKFSESLVNEITREKGDTGFWNWYHRCHIFLKYYFENKFEVWQLQATVVVSTQTAATTRLLSFALLHRWLSETNLIRWVFLCVLWCNIHPLAQGSTNPSICPLPAICFAKIQPTLPSNRSANLFLHYLFKSLWVREALYFLLDLRRRSRGVTLVWISGFPKAVASLSALDSVLSLPFFRVYFAQILASENFTLACPSPGNCPAVHSWEQPFNMIFFWLYYEVGVPGENPHRQGEHAMATQQDPKWPANSNLLQQLWKTWYHSVAACIKRAVWRKLRLRQISFILQCLKEMTCTN